MLLFERQLAADGVFGGGEIAHAHAVPCALARDLGNHQVGLLRAKLRSKRLCFATVLERAELQGEVHLALGRVGSCGANCRGGHIFRRHRRLFSGLLHDRQRSKCLARRGGRGLGRTGRGSRGHRFSSREGGFGLGGLGRVSVERGSQLAARFGQSFFRFGRSRLVPLTVLGRLR